jgi:protein TonB
MPRSALILSCAIHGSVLAVVGWSALLSAPRPEPAKAEMSVSLSSSKNALVVTEEDVPTPDSPAALAEASFAPPAPTIDPPPAPVTAVETAPPTVPSLASPSGMPEKTPPVATPKTRRAPRVAGASSGIASATSAGGGPGYAPPQFLVRYKPPYPEQARAQRLEGVVLLLVSIDVQGHVISASIRQSCGHLVLDRAALDSVHTWRFSPGRQDGHAIPATVEIPIRFNFSA